MNAVSSINAYSGWLDNSAANVAGSSNADSVNRQSTITSQNGAPTLQTRAEKQDVSLEKEMTDQMVIPKAAEADAAAIRTENEMSGSLLNLLA